MILPNIYQNDWILQNFANIVQGLPWFAKVIEHCQVLVMLCQESSKVIKYCQVLPKLLNCIKFSPNLIKCCANVMFKFY